LIARAPRNTAGADPRSRVMLNDVEIENELNTPRP
jgi:hypothetical protein